QFATALIEALPSTRARISRLAAAGGAAALLVALAGGLTAGYLAGATPPTELMSSAPKTISSVDPAEALAIRQVIAGSNTAWSAAVGPGGTAEALIGFYTASRLLEAQNTVSDLRRQQEYRQASLIDLRVA